MAAKHITIANESGIEAGFEAFVEYLGTPVGSRNPNVQSFIDKIEGLAFDDALQVYAETYFAEPEAQEPESKIRVISLRGNTRKAKTPATPKGNGKATRTTKPSRKVKTATGCVTAGEAWVALGSNPDFEPRDSDKPANNGQLYRLNTSGLLRLNA